MKHRPIVPAVAVAFLVLPFALGAAPPGECPAGKAGSEEREITIKWENVPVAAAMKALLGDALGVDYDEPTTPTQRISMRADTAVNAIEAVELLDGELAKQGLKLRCEKKKYVVARFAQ